MTAIAVGDGHSVGLRSDGTVIATGNNESGQCDVGEWKDIVAIAAGDCHTLGLCSDGKVLATGNDQEGNLRVGNWKDVQAISAGWMYSAGLKKDGTVITCGYDEYGQRDVGSWSDIVAMDAGASHVVGLRSDGTVVGAGRGFGEIRDILDVEKGAHPSESEHGTQDDDAIEVDLQPVSVPDGITTEVIAPDEKKTVRWLTVKPDSESRNGMLEYLDTATVDIVPAKVVLVHNESDQEMSLDCRVGDNWLNGTEWDQILLQSGRTGVYPSTSKKGCEIEPSESKASGNNYDLTVNPVEVGTGTLVVEIGGYPPDKWNGAAYVGVLATSKNDVIFYDSWHQFTFYTGMGMEAPYRYELDGYSDIRWQDYDLQFFDFNQFVE